MHGSDFYWLQDGLLMELIVLEQKEVEEINAFDLSKHYCNSEFASIYRKIND